MKRRNLLAAVLSFSLVIGMSAPVDLAQESKKTQTAVSIEDSVGEVWLSSNSSETIKFG